MKNLLLTLISLLFVGSITAQTDPSIKGTAIDNEGEPLLYANILLHTAQDSVFTKAELTDENGLYNFIGIPAGNYFIKISYVGLEEFSSEVFSLKDGEQKIISTYKLSNKGNNLDEVTVTAERNMIEVRPDKIVFNVENSISAGGTNALELLRKAPGVILDNNENVTLMGKSGVRIYINDRPSRMGGDDLAAYLRSLNSSDIDAIEIITNPSAKYEAEGNAGIINIKLKKNKNFGTNGSVTLNYGNGVVDNYGGQAQLNHRNKFYNIFGSYGYNDGASYNFERLNRQQAGVFYNQVFDHYDYYKGHNLRVGADFFINKNHTIGFIASARQSDFDGDGFSTTDIGKINTPTVIDSVLIATALIPQGENKNYDANLNYQIKGENGLLWNFDANYGNYNRETDHEYNNYYTDSERQNDRPEIINEDSQDTQIDIYTAKLDFERNVGKGKLGAGLKTSIVDTDNLFDFYDVENGNKILNAGRTSEFSYIENVNAAYLNYDFKKDKWSYQLGLRAEQSLTEGNLVLTGQDSIVTRDYIDIFPSAGATYQVNQKSSIGFGYSRRLDRPNYQNLNPFNFLINEKTTSTGNPFLRPQYTTNIQVTHTYNYSISTILKYSKTKDLMTRFSEAVLIEGDSIGKPTGESFFWGNLGSQENLSLNFSAPYQIKDWWSTYTSITAYVVSNQGDYGDGKVVDIVRPAINLYGQHTFKLPKDFSFEVSGWFGTGAVWGGNFETGNMGALSLGLQKKLFKNQGTLKINMSDIFKTSQWSAMVNFGELTTEGYGGWDSQRLTVSYTHSFGNQKIKKQKKKHWIGG